MSYLQTMNELVQRVELLAISNRHEAELSEKEQNLIEKLQALHEDYVSAIVGLDGCEYITNLVKRGKDVTADGFNVFREIQKKLAQFVINPSIRVSRSPMQIEFHNRVLLALLPHIYGREWAMNQDAVLKRHNLHSLRQHLLLSCPRRFGKTTGVAMLVAAVLYCIPKQIKIIVCCQNTAAAMVMIKCILLLLDQLSANDSVFFVSNNNRPTIIYSRQKRKDDPTASTVTGIPSGSDNIRGGDGDIIIFDEMAFLKSSVISVVAPMLRKEGSILIGLSSLQKDNASFFTRLLDEKDQHGNLLFEVYRSELVCYECRQKNANIACPHLEDDLPDFLTRNADEVIRALMSSDNLLYQTEILGITHSLSVQALNAVHLKEFYDSVPLHPQEDIYMVHIFVDPSGGGTSNSAIVSFVILADYEIVVFSSSSSKSNDIFGFCVG